VKLSKTQYRVLKAFQKYVAKHEYAPTLQELGEEVGISSKGTIHRHIQVLIEAGYLAYSSSGWRNLQLANTVGWFAPTPQKKACFPILGRIAAGLPIEAIENKAELNLTDVFDGEGRYILEVRGNSMIDAGILEGDMVVIERRDSADDGSIVVAIIDGYEATLKRLRYQADRSIALVPENRDMQPMIYEPSRINVQGVLVGQFRKYG
jgi:repressor LexA